jgi:hypothetical protein
LIGRSRTLSEVRDPIEPPVRTAVEMASALDATFIFRKIARGGS